MAQRRAGSHPVERVHIDVVAGSEDARHAIAICGERIETRVFRHEAEAWEWAETRRKVLHISANAFISMPQRRAGGDTGEK